MDALGEQIGGEEQRLAAADAEYRGSRLRLLEAVAGHSGEELPMRAISSNSVMGQR